MKGNNRWLQVNFWRNVFGSS